jgi:HAD superfamily hydrolase (TIGR01509 family)
VLWDLDGTIADTSELHFHSWRLTLAEEGIIYSWDDFERDFGRSNPELLLDLLPDLTTEEHRRIADAKEAAYRRVMIGRLTVLPGVKAWMQGFHSVGIPQVICSSGPMANIAATIVELGLADYCLALITGIHVPRGKPAPDLFLRGAAVANVAPEQCLVIEDSRHGVEAAARAGMCCLVVGALARHRSELATQFAHSHDLMAAAELNVHSWEAVLDTWQEKNL